MEEKMIKDRLFLKKVFDSYVLHRIKDGILTIEGDSHYTIGGIEPFYKLSISKCRAIEFGYDLNELAKEKYPYKVTRTDFATEECRKIWIDGFQKALEILGDKKFSEDDVKKAMHITINYELKRDTQSYQEKIDFLKSLQQAEWDVDIVTTTIMENGKCGLDVPIIKPKFDSNNCLILKRK